MVASEVQVDFRRRGRKSLREVQCWNRLLRVAVGT